MERLYRSFSPRPQIIKKTQCPRANDFVDWYFSTRLDGDRGSTSVQQHGSARSFLSTRKHTSKMKETRAYAELVCDTLAASFDFPATVQPERFCIALCQSPLCARFPVYPTINPFLSSSFRRCSIPCFRLVTTFHFLVPRYLATFCYSSSSRNVPSLFTRFPPRFHLLSKQIIRSMRIYIFLSTSSKKLRTWTEICLVPRVYKTLWSFNRVNLLFLSPIFVIVRNFDGTSSSSDPKEPRFTFSTLYDSSPLSFRFFHRRRPFSLSAKYLPLETQIHRKLPLSSFLSSPTPFYLAKRHPLSVRTI